MSVDPPRSILWSFFLLSLSASRSQIVFPFFFSLLHYLPHPFFVTLISSSPFPLPSFHFSFSCSFPIPLFFPSPFCCFSFSLSSLYFTLVVSSSFPPPLSFSLFFSFSYLLALTPAQPPNYSFKKSWGEHWLDDLIAISLLTWEGTGLSTQQNFLKAEYLSSLLVGKMATTSCSFLWIS